jgi:hypothetical protein
VLVLFRKGGYKEGCILHAVGHNAGRRGIGLYSGGCWWEEEEEEEEEGRNLVVAGNFLGELVLHCATEWILAVTLVQASVRSTAKVNGRGSTEDTSENDDTHDWVSTSITTPNFLHTLLPVNTRAEVGVGAESSLLSETV